jgi:GH15 family glucan-1,4-alpha-glucosidase
VSYLPIEHHAVIGDLHTAALVGLDGTIDWLCLPNFDSPSVFASILDARRGGFCRIAAVSPDARRRQMYLPDSNVLLTRFLTPDGVGEIVDFMPIATAPGGKRAEDHQVIRYIRGVRGAIPFRLECRPAFEYGLTRVAPAPAPWGWRFAAEGAPLDVLTTLACDADEDGLTAEFLLEEGRDIPFVIARGGEGPRPDPSRLVDLCTDEFWETLRFWQNWIGKSRYQGRWRETVKRSALALKLLTFAPTGAIVAAPTTSLPERIGGSRNWDYRYTWLRDAAITLSSLLRTGYR